MDIIARVNELTKLIESEEKLVSAKQFNIKVLKSKLKQYQKLVDVANKLEDDRTTEGKA